MELEKLQHIVAEVLNVDPSEVQMDSTLKNDLGADSLDCYQIIMKVEKTFNIHLDVKDIEKCVVIGDVIKIIKKAMR